VTWAGIAVIVVKIIIVIMFLLNMAAVGVWADRRQSAMLQHRVGPNRAVVFVPSNALRGVLFLTTAAFAAAVAIPMWWRTYSHPQYMTVTIEIAVLVAWFSLLLLCNHVRRNGADNTFDRLVARAEPRSYFYFGLAVHLVALLLIRWVPDVSFRADGYQWATGLSGTFASVVIMSAGFYAAAKLPDGKTAVRLAGTLHSVADAIKLIWKEDLRPRNADKVLFALAPLLAMFPALVTIAVIPFGSTLCFTDTNKDAALDFADLMALADTVGRSGECAAGQIAVHLQVADLNVGLLYVFGIAGTGIIGAALAGWASDNKFALLGGLRAASQMVSYEVAMGLAISGMLMVTGTVHMQKIVDWQGDNTWGIFAQPLAFILFFVAVIAETKRVPFDQPEGESEIVAGYFLEYSGMKFGLFFLGEYAEFVFSSALMVTLFFGGYHLPFLHADGITIAFGATTLLELKMGHLAVSAIHVAAFFGKTILFAWFHLFIRWTLPRFRYDQLMKLGWTKLLPLSLVNILLTGVVLLAIDGGSETVTATLDFVADVTQGVVAVAGLVGIVALITGLLEPSRPDRVVQSTSARYASAAGGVKATEMTP